MILNRVKSCAMLHMKLRIYKRARKQCKIKPLSHQTALPPRLYSVLNHVTVLWERREIRLKISNLPVIACTQRPHSVPTAISWRSHSVFTAFMTFSQLESSCCSVFTARTQRAHGAHTAFSRRTHSVLTAIIVFEIFYLFYFYFE